MSKRNQKDKTKFLFLLNNDKCWERLGGLRLPQQVNLQLSTQPEQKLKVAISESGIKKSSIKSRYAILLQRFNLT